MITALAIAGAILLPIAIVVVVGVALVLKGLFETIHMRPRLHCAECMKTPRSAILFPVREGAYICAVCKKPFYANIQTDPAGNHTMRVGSAYRGGNNPVPALPASCPN